MFNKLKALVISRRFYAALTAVLIALGQDYLGLDEQQATVIAGVLMTWVLGDSLKDTN